MAGAQLPREGDTHCLLGRAFHIRPRSRHLSRTTIRILTPATDSPAATRRHGDCVLFGFHIRAFVTGAFVVPISRVAGADPRACGAWRADGSSA
jgi:hypothetical protein